MVTVYCHFTVPLKKYVAGDVVLYMISSVRFEVQTFLVVPLSLTRRKHVTTAVGCSQSKTIEFAQAWGVTGKRLIL